jgi:hypothetical protein
VLQDWHVERQNLRRLLEQLRRRVITPLSLASVALNAKRKVEVTTDWTVPITWTFLVVLASLLSVKGSFLVHIKLFFDGVNLSYFILS